MNPLDPHAFTLENAVDPKTTDTVAVERPPTPSLGDLMLAQQEKLRQETDALLAGLRSGREVRPCRCPSCVAETIMGSPYRGAPPLEVDGRCPSAVETPVRSRWDRFLCWLGRHRCIGLDAVTERGECSWAWENCACGATRLVVLHHCAGARVTRYPWNFPARTI